MSHSKEVNDNVTRRRALTDDQPLPEFVNVGILKLEVEDQNNNANNANNGNNVGDDNANALPIIPQPQRNRRLLGEGVVGIDIGAPADNSNVRGENRESNNNRAAILTAFRNFYHLRPLPAGAQMAAGNVAVQRLLELPAGVQNGVPIAAGNVAGQPQSVLNLAEPEEEPSDLPELEEDLPEQQDPLVLNAFNNAFNNIEENSAPESPRANASFSNLRYDAFSGNYINNINNDVNATEVAPLTQKGHIVVRCSKEHYTQLVNKGVSAIRIVSSQRVPRMFTARVEKASVVERASVIKNNSRPT